MNQNEDKGFTVTIGDPQIQQDFVNRHFPLLHGLKNLKVAFDSGIFNMPAKERELHGRVIYYLSRMVWEDFNEIITLCANGLSTGAMKILRGMFERAVYVCYFQKHEDEVKSFWDFYWIDQRKLTSDIEKEYPGTFSKEKLAEAESKYNEVKESFQVPVCRECRIPECEACKKTRTNYSWSKKDIVSMAKEVKFDPFTITGAYYIPMQETHPKASAIIRRINLREDNTIDYDDNPKPSQDESTLVCAHWLVLKTLEVMQETFNIEAMKEPIQECLSDFKKIWEGRKEVIDI